MHSVHTSRMLVFRTNLHHLREYTFTYVHLHVEEEWWLGLIRHVVICRTSSKTVKYCWPLFRILWTLTTIRIYILYPVTVTYTKKEIEHTSHSRMRVLSLKLSRVVPRYIANSASAGLIDKKIARKHRCMLHRIVSSSIEFYCLQYEHHSVLDKCDPTFLNRIPSMNGIRTIPSVPSFFLVFYLDLLRLLRLLDRKIKRERLILSGYRSIHS